MSLLMENRLIKKDASSREIELTLPNFIIVGAAKSGTTSLHYYMEQHPDVFMSRQKETHYFAFEGRNPVFGGPGDDRDLRYSFVTSLEAYEEQFREASTESAIGEASPWYLYSTESAANIHKRLPDAKLIAVLRNPVDRAFSSYLHLVRERREHLSFEEALLAEDERVAQGWSYMWHYRRAGFYAEQVERFFEFFDREQLRIYLYEDLAHPASLLTDAYAFLGVNPRFTTDTSVKHQATGVPRNELLGRLLFEPNPAKSTLKRFLPQQFRRGLRERVGQRLLEKPKLDQGIERKLMDAYEDDILKLQRLVGKDLSAWLERR